MLKTINVGTLKDVFVKYDTNQIKNNCFVCGKWIRNNEEIYEKSGNCCSFCSGCADRSVKANSKIDNCEKKILILRTNKSKRAKKMSESEKKGEIEKMQKDILEAKKELEKIDNLYKQIYAKQQTHI